MVEDLSISFLINNGVAVGVAWYVLSKINPTLEKLTDAINKLSDNVNHRLDKLESNERNTQMQLHEVKVQIDAIKRGDA